MSSPVHLLYVPTLRNVLHVASDGPTPAELIERLRQRLGVDGKPLSDDKLAERVGATRQQVIRWRKHGRGMTRKYAERFAALDGEHKPEDFMSGPALVLDQRALLDRLARIDDAILQMIGRSAVKDAQAEAKVERMLDLVASQLEAQSDLLERLVEVAARMERAADRAERASGGRG